MSTTLSIRIRRELKEKMLRISEVDWRSEIEKFIEEKIREIELKKILNAIDDVLKEVKKSKEYAWKTIREYRELR